METPEDPIADDFEDERIPLRGESLSRRHRRRSADAFSMRNRPLVILLFASVSLLLGVWLSRYHTIFDEWAPAPEADNGSRAGQATIVIEDDWPPKRSNGESKEIRSVPR